MKESKPDFTDLIAKYYSNSLTEHDSVKLKSWIDEHPDNKDMFIKYISLLQDYKKIEFLDKVDTRAKFDRHNSTDPAE